jgi:hypothetical protein
MRRVSAYDTSSCIEKLKKLEEKWRLKQRERARS